jgi:hypothetical protein
MFNSHTGWKTASSAIPAEPRIRQQPIRLHSARQWKNAHQTQGVVRDSTRARVLQLLVATSCCLLQLTNQCAQLRRRWGTDSADQSFNGLKLSIEFLQGKAPSLSRYELQWKKCSSSSSPRVAGLGAGVEPLNSSRHADLQRLLPITGLALPSSRIQTFQGRLHLTFSKPK